MASTTVCCLALIIDVVSILTRRTNEDKNRAKKRMNSSVCTLVDPANYVETQTVRDDVTLRLRYLLTYVL